MSHFDPHGNPVTLGTDESMLEASVVELIERLDLATESGSEDRVALFSKLTQIATALDLDRSRRFMSRLESINKISSRLQVAFEFYAGQLALRGEEYELTRTHCEAGRALALALRWEAEVACFCILRGTLEYRLGNYSGARIHFEEAVVAARRAGSRQLEGRAAMNLGLAQKNSGDLPGAERLLRFAVAVAREIDGPSNIARSEVNLANALIRRGAWQEAHDLARHAAQAFQALSLTNFVLTARLTELRALRLLGEPQRARDELASLLELAHRQVEPRSIVLALEFIGDCDLDLGNYLSAHDSYREALLLARSHGPATDLVLECLRGLATVELAQGALANARTLVEESISIARTQGDLFELACSLLVSARIQTELGQEQDSFRSLEEARSLAWSIGAEKLTQETIALPIRTLGLLPARPSSSTPIISFPGFISMDPGVQRTLATVRKLAPRSLNILIHGETGTGKELIARAIHAESGRPGPLVPVNCSAFPGDLIEGELFGHARGAYTGADRERAGLFEHADKGTLFLDEIGDMPVKAQARLLRALEGGEVRRLGENNPRLVDVRVVAATHRDLMTMVGSGDFRLDLYYRLAGYVVEVPPIRERMDDARLIIDYYFAHFAKEQHKSVSMTPDVRQQLIVHSWPGNVREIRFVMERLVSLIEDGVVLRSLPFTLEGEPRPRTLPEHLEAEEKRRIVDALRAHNWNKQRAATTLGTNRTTLIGKMKRMGIPSRKP